MNLRDAQLFIEIFPLGTRSYAPTVEPAIQLKLTWLNLKIGDILQFQIESANVKQHEGENGSVLYDYRLLGLSTRFCVYLGPLTKYVAGVGRPLMLRTPPATVPSQT